jgi:SAM-dependent methyltransferase
VPGLGSLLIDEAGGGDREFDGRADIVVLEAPGNAPPLDLRLAEDVFVEVAATPRAESPRQIAAVLFEHGPLDRALSVLGGVRPLRASMTYRVICRVRSERDFQRTALRDELAATIAAAKPRWRPGDPADVELWALETRPGQFRLGLRLTVASHRQHGGRVEERSGALRPAVAAAMVRLAGGPPEDAPALLDPCCGSGTLLREGVALGWQPIGSDVDEEAAYTAARNTGAPVAVADAAHLPLRGGLAGAATTNLPFGHKFRLPESPVRWFTALLSELERVTIPGAPIVVLIPDVSDWRVALDRHGRPPNTRVDIRLLGMDTAIWRL